LPLTFAQRFLAAFEATVLRSSAVMVSIRRFPPILPPRLPISAMTFDIMLGVGLASRVDSSTIWCAHWLTSFGLFGLLNRFGML
jgi:hypothetical protein